MVPTTFESIMIFRDDLPIGKKGGNLFFLLFSLFYNTVLRIYPMLSQCRTRLYNNGFSIIHGYT